MMGEGDLLWTPSAARVERSHVAAFMRWLARERNLHFTDYADLWQWSVRDVEAFWKCVWEYFEVQSSAPYTHVLARGGMPGADWFPGARLNYAQRALAHERPDAIALTYVSERVPLAHMSWTDLGARVRVLATQLRNLGVAPGDRVVAVLPNIPEVVIAMLATVSIGAVWSCCGPDYGPAGLLDRFAPLEPRVLICVDGYCYGGKSYDRKPQLRQLIAQIPSLRHVIQVPYLDTAERNPLAPNVLFWNELFEHPPVPQAEFRFEQVPFDHPLWILFSSGTTGLPKAIVHGHGGILLEHLKHMHFNFELHAGERMFFYVTTGWMVWNFLVSSLLSNVVPVLYDGSPVFPTADALWKVIQDSGAALFGTSPAFVAQQQSAGTRPKNSFDLSRLESVTLAGSPVTAQCMQWFYENVKQDLWVASGSGGTDCCTGFVGGVSILPVYAGEIQARALGCAAYAFDENGQVLVDQVGELVITRPMPSMPVRFWNDPGNRRYLEAYFEQYPGVWRHGDFVRFNARGGSYVLGRSDATLNRHGIRIGTAEIYRTLERVEEIDDSLIVNLDLPGGRFFMPLFVKLRPGRTLDDPLCGRICARLRSENSPRHVPDRIYAVDAIPYTLTGKKLEVPVRRILMGVNPEKAANRSAIANSAALDYFIAFAEERRDYSMDA
jgi:acetoacetyl-CoA synthetase